MIEAVKGPNEAQRQLALDDYDVLDTDPERAFDDLTQIASRVCGTPIALVSLVDMERQWFKSRVGTDATETPRSIAFCAHAILDPDNVMVVSDAHEDIRFVDNPLVVEDPRIRFYAGAPLVSPEGQAIGTLCVIDKQPRMLDANQVETLRALARQVVGQLELRRKYNELKVIARDLDAARNGLERRNAEINTFYHTLAHELKSPLTAAREFISIVMDQIAGPVTADQHEYLGTARTCCDQIRRHIEDLLDMTRLETGKLGLERKTAAISPLVSLSVASALPAARKKKIVLRSDVDTALPPLLMDERRMTQVLSNLIGNAIKFTGTGGEIVVSACHAKDEGCVQIAVSDSGIGIESQHLDRIFDRLYQVRTDDSTIKGGLGIGLCLCREIARLHDGVIKVESIPGRGSTFTVSIPVLKESAGFLAEQRMELTQ